MRTELLGGALALLLMTGCGGGGATDGPPSLTMGQDRCAACSMAVSDPAFAAAARLADGTVLAYDAPECLVRDLRTRTGATAPAAIWLADLPSATLRPADTMTLVLADFPSPMGGGYAAFADAALAATEANARHGVAAPLAAFVAGTARRPEH